MRSGPLPGPALGWPASPSRAGHARVELSGVPALDARQSGGLFPPLGSGRRFRRSTARCCCGSSKMSCYGSSRPTRSPIFAPGGSNEVVLGDQLASQAPTAKISTLQDVERGKRLEVDETLGYAVRQSAALGIPTPTMEVCYKLLAGINHYLQ